jgi:hypothetical protein
MRATVKVAPTNAGIPSIFVRATFTVALFARIIYYRKSNFIVFSDRAKNIENLAIGQRNTPM